MLKELLKNDLIKILNNKKSLLTISRLNIIYLLKHWRRSIEYANDH